MILTAKEFLLVRSVIERLKKKGSRQRIWLQGLIVLLKRAAWLLTRYFQIGQSKDFSLFRAMFAGHLVADNDPVMSSSRAYSTLPSTGIDVFFIHGSVAYRIPCQRHLPANYY